MPIIPCVLSLHTSMIASAFLRYAVSVKLLACTASGYETEQTEKIPIQLRTQRLSRAQTRHVVDALQMRGVVQPAGAVAEDDVRPARLQHPHKRADHRRMDRRGLLRLHRGDQIQLQRHAHPGRDPVQPARGRDSRLQRGRDLRILIVLQAASATSYRIPAPPDVQNTSTLSWNRRNCNARKPRSIYF